MKKDYKVLVYLSAILLVLILANCATKQQPITHPEYTGEPFPNFGVNNAVVDVHGSEMFSCDGKTPAGKKFGFAYSVPGSNVPRLFMSWVFAPGDLVISEYYPTGDQSFKQLWIDYGYDRVPEYYFDAETVKNVPGYPDMCKVIENFRK